MRQPLTTIEYLLQGALTTHEDSPTRETLTGISQQVKYLADLAGDLLNEDRDVRESVDVGALLQAVVATVQSQVEESGPGYEGEPRSELSLGLSITEQVARAHGGRVEAGVSDWLGGAAFRLLLPSPNR